MIQNILMTRNPTHKLPINKNYKTALLKGLPLITRITLFSLIGVLLYKYNMSKKLNG